MPRKGWIDKKNATKYTLVHRPQNDPLFHDTEAAPMVFAPTTVPNTNKIQTRGDLESTFQFADERNIRDNEGEAAEHGIFYDDSEYDYMQHLRDVGNGGGTYIEAEESVDKQKGKEKMSLEDALAASSLQDRDSLSTSSYSEVASQASQYSRKVTYQDQQDVPDSIAGFKPDMDPRLREALEALEDDAYVDDNDELFAELSKDHNEVSLEDFEDSTFDFDDEDSGWDSDHTAKPETDHPPTLDDPDALPLSDPAPPSDDTPSASDPNPAWMAEFQKFKKDTRPPRTRQPAPPNPATSSLLSSRSSLASGRRKKRKGALTDPSNYSMTSSSLARTDGLTLLDSRFDRIDEEYSLDGLDDNDAASSIAPSAISGVSSRAGEVRGDFDGVMDEFLSGHSVSGKRRVKRGPKQSGMQQLDEVRKGLGPARRKAIIQT